MPSISAQIHIGTIRAPKVVPSERLNGSNQPPSADDSVVRGMGSLGRLIEQITEAI